MIGEYFLLALDNLKHRGIRSWLTMIGIFIGIAAVVSLISLSNGLENAVTGQFAALSTDRLIIQSAETFFGPPGSTAVRKLNDNDMNLISSVNGIDMIIPRLVRSAKIEYNDVLGFKYFGSMPNNAEQMNYLYDSLSLKVNEGRLLKAGDKKKILLGSDFAKKEEFGKLIELSSSIKLQGERFEVIGILEKSSSLEVNNAALIMEDDLKEILNITDEIDLIMVKVTSEERVNEVADLIKKKLRRDRNQKEGEEDFSVQTPAKAVESVNTILNIINLIVTGIAAISLLVGGIGIANTMYTSVLERIKEIGVMKAIGAMNSDVLKIFLIEAGLLGLVGGIVGAIIGISFAFLTSSIANYAFGQQLILVEISYPLVFASIAFAFGIGLASGILPAVQASQLKPVEALRA